MSTCDPSSQAALRERTLDQVVRRIGDPAPQVYARLFVQSPELQPMFVADTAGSVRGEMFLRALEAMQGLAEGQPYADGMIASEWSNHFLNGVETAQFAGFFALIVDVFRDALGADWTPQAEAAWQQALQAVDRVVKSAAAPRQAAPLR